MLCNLSKHNTTYTIQIQTLSTRAMTTTIASKRCRWWRAIGYELSMLRGLRDFVCVSTSSAKDRTAWLLHNIITEGQVLHTRNLCDFCTSTNSNDIRTRDLFDN